MSLLRADKIANRFNNTGPIIVGPSTVSGNFTVTGILTALGIGVTNSIFVGSALTAKYITATNGASLFNSSLTGVTTAGIVTGATYYGNGVNLSGIVTSIVAGSGIQISPSNGQGRVTISATQTEYSNNAGLATDVKGGTAGAVLYQIGTDDTGFTSVGSTGEVLQSTGTSSPVWASFTAVNVEYADNTGIATNLKGGSAGRIPYQTGIDATAFLPIGSTGKVLFGQGTLAPIWIDPKESLDVRYSNFAGITSFTNLAGIATSVIGGISSVTSLNVTGITTLGGGNVTIENDLNVSGIGSITQLDVSGNTTLTQVQASNISVSGVVTSTLFEGRLIGVSSLTELSVSGISTLNQLEVSDVNASGIITANSFYGNLVGIASTSIDVIGGIGSIRALNVSGITTLNTLEVSGVSTFNDNVSIGTETTLTTNTITTLEYFGDGINLSGIVTQITAGIGVNLQSTQNPGKGVVNINSYFPIGKTIFVSQTGDDSNTGLSENHPKRTIKSAAAIAFPGDTIKVYPGVYVENNPIQLSTRVSVEGTELRNCVVTPRYLDRDLFHVNNSCHVTDLSFVSANDMTDGAAIIALQPLLGVSTDRFFDAARMIRYNLDFIAAETVGYLTSTDYKNPAFVVVDGSGNPIAPVNCSDDIKDVMKSIIHDITRGGNLKCVGAGKSYFDDAGSLLHITGTDTNGYSVKEATIEALNYAAGIARSCINNVSWNGNYQTQYSQVKDLAIQADAATGSNEDIGSCANVVSAIYSCVGVVTTIINQGLSILGTGINTTFPGNSGLGTDSVIGVTSAVYNNTSGETTIIAPSLSVKEGDIVEVRDLLFDCTSGGSIGTQKYPSGKYGYLFDVIGVSTVTEAFTINTGISTIPHTYVGGGYVVNRAIGVTTASYDNTTGVTTITAPGAVVKVGQFVRLHDLEFSCTSGAGTTTLYPTGNLGYEFRVTEVIGVGNTFVVNVGPSTIPHTYESGGFVFPPYSPGVGPITQGPYIRNCTNFVPKSIGMKVDGFEAEPGDKDDIGVTGTMSVDSYTQYNQGGIGVSITNGAYSQLVSIFTICDDIAIFTGSGGQCDITNSNSSFGRLGLVADGVGDYDTKSIYRYTGIANTEAAIEQAVIEVSGIGNLRPYDGQTLHFGELYYEVESIIVTNGGFGYTQAPIVTVDFPTGPNGIRAEASANINAFGQVTSIDIISTGSQYRLGDNPQITITGPTGAGTTAEATLNLYPIYYTIESATLPNAGISTVTLNTNLNNTVSTGTTVYFNRLSLQITSSHSFEWVGSGNDINTAKPALGGVVIQENEVVKLNGGEVVYTSTDQAGNFKIGDDVTINQITGTITGRAFSQSLLNTVTPLIIALGN